MPVCGVNLVTIHLSTLLSVPTASLPSNQLPLGFRHPSAAICESPSFSHTPLSALLLLRFSHVRLVSSPSLFSFDLPTYYLSPPPIRPSLDSSPSNNQTPFHLPTLPALPLHCPSPFRPALDLTSSDIESFSKSSTISTTRPCPGASTAVSLSRKLSPCARAYSAANPTPILDQNSPSFTLRRINNFNFPTKLPPIY